MRILIAARLSQLADGQTGLDTQDAESQAWATANGHTVVHVAADRKSGTSAPWDRKNLRPWVTSDAKLAQYDAVLAYRLDRLTRGDNQSTNAIERWAHDHGKMLLTVDGLRFPCEGADGIRWDVTKRIAHDEWLKTSERYRRMQGYLRSAGKLVGRPPFGYEPRAAGGGHKALYPSFDGKTYVPEIFQRVIDGETLAAVALWLTAEGVPTANQKAVDWSANRVGAIIRCPTYKGRRCEWNPEARRYGRVLHTCPELVDAGTWKAANDALDKRPGRGRRGGTVHETALLSGVLTCPGCAGPMYRVHCGTAPNRQPYYRCAGVLKGVRRASCRNMVLCSTADRLAERFLSELESPVLREVTTPATDYADKLEKVADELADLPRLGLDEDKEDARRAELRAERKRLAALHGEPSKTVLAVTDETYGQVWRALEPSARNAWLRSSGITFSAAKTSSGLAEQWIAGLHWPYSEASRLLTADGVSVVVSWLMSGLDDAENIGAEFETQ